MQNFKIQSVRGSPKIDVLKIFSIKEIKNKKNEAHQKNFNLKSIVKDYTIRFNNRNI